MTQNTTSPAQPLLEIRGLKIEGFADDKWHQIVKGVALTLNRGEVLGLIGESGAGKSTLGLAAMGYAKPGCRFNGGEVLFRGEDLLKANEARKRQLRGTRIAYVAQSAAASFNPAHRLIDQIVESALRQKLMTRAVAEAKCIDLFRQLRLPDPESFGNRFIHQVSGGQLQRAMTAMAMLTEPDLIIFDEPTTALDVTTQVEVLASMRALIEQRQTAAIYITHDLAVVAQMAHRIMVLRYGVEVESAPAREMLAAPKDDYTKSLWAVRALQKPSEAQEDVILRVRNVTASYGKRPVLHDVSLIVPRGRTVALVGESGSGKSTLGRVISGLLSADKGQLEFDGQPIPADLRARGIDLVKRIQMIHQLPDTALNPRQTIRDILGRPVELFQGKGGKARTRAVVELLDRIELSPALIDRYPGELSGGQKQRICIARALAAEPQIIICDEVTSALDQVVQEEILQLLLSLQRENGLSYLLITHDLATVRAIADQVVVMFRGEVVEQGAKEEVLTPPHADYTKLLLSSVPEMDPDWLSRLLALRKTA